MLSVKSIRIMNRLASKIAGYREIYTKRLATSPNKDLVNQKPANMLFAVLLALLNDSVEVRMREGASPTQVVSLDAFYSKLVKLRVREGLYSVPNLSSFLAYKNESNYIDVKKLATATGEFLKSEYLQSFGTSKKKLA